jgi:hypothetical protein
MKQRWRSLLLVLGFGSTIVWPWNLPSRADEPSANMDLPWSYARWKNGPPSSDQYFPIAVWLQDPANAPRFKAAGFNLYVGLWEGPTHQQLAALRAVDMPVICSQNAVGLADTNNPIIVGWMHGDEPDNAQGIPGLRRYGPPILPERIVQEYDQFRAADPTRPVMLNLGQGVAYDNYIGRGVRRNRPEDYPRYLQGCDIVSFDIYPVVHETPEIAGKLEYVAKGVERLRQWSRGEKRVWNCIECTHVSNPQKKATPAQVRAEVWMALIHGSRGLIYFVHQFEPVFKEAALLEDQELLPAVTAINRQILELAPVINSSNRLGGVSVRVEAPQQILTPNADTLMAPPSIAWMQKVYRGSTYLFTVNMRPVSQHIVFTITDSSGSLEADVLSESRRLPVEQGRLADSFLPYEVHLYAIGPHQ